MTERQRPRLQLKPRDPDAVARAEIERSASGKSNPFGSAKPREAVLATRSGRSEQEILAEEVKKQGLKLRLNSEQRQQKEAAEATIADLQDQETLETDPDAKLELQKQIVDGKAGLDELMEAFAKSTLDAAAKGEIQRPSERRAAQGLGQQQPDDFANFQQGGGRAPAQYGGGGGGYQGAGGSDGFGGGSFGGGSFSGGGGGGGGRLNQSTGGQYQDRHTAHSGGGGATNGGYQDAGPAPYQNQDRF